MHAVLLRKLSQSSSTRVEMARLPDGQQVVVKRALHPEAQGRIQHEIAFLQQLTAVDGVPRLLLAEEDRLVRSYIPGQSIAQLRRQGSLSRRQLCAWLKSLEYLLQQIHAAGQWHGDIAPHNILVTADNAVILLDCGAPGWGTPPYYDGELQGAEADLQALERLRQELLGGEPCPPDNLTLTRLVGRDQEIHILNKAWQSAGYQESTWIGVEAASGGGKSALLRELLFATDYRAWGQCSTLSTPIGYNLFQSLLEGWMPEDLPQELPLKEIHWRQFLSTFAGLGQAERRQAPVAPMLLAQAWSELLSALCSRSPFLLLLDDVQWMDESSRALLQALGRRPIPGLMVVLAWRQGEFDPHDLPLQSLLRLSPLSPQQVAHWAEHQQAELSEAEASRLAEWTQGNPLLISEWLSQPSRPSPAFSPRAGLLLQERLRQLGSEATQVLQVAALLGRQFSDEPLRGIGLSLDALRHAEDLQLLLPGRRFSHDKVRESLLADITPEDARNWHRHLGDYFARKTKDVAQAAFHYAHAHDLEAAAPLALRVARRHASRSALSSAAYFYEISCRQQPQPAVLWEYAQVLMLLGHQDEAVARLENGLRDCSDGEWLAPISLTLANLYQKSSNYTHAVKHCQQAWKHLRHLPATQARDLEPKILTTLLESRHENQQVREFIVDLLQRLPRLGKSHWGDPLFSSDLLLAASFAGLPVPHRSWRKRFLSRVNRVADPLKWARVVSRLLVFNFMERRMAFHRRMLKVMVNHYQEHGEPWEMCMNAMQIGLYAIVAGDFKELAQLSQQIEEIASLTGDGSQRAVSLHFTVVASGGRVSWQTLQSLDRVSVTGYGLANRAMAQAHYLLRQQRPEAALQLLRSITTYNPIDGSMLRALHSCAARQSGDATPRRWGKKRRELYTEALEAGKKALRYEPFGHIHSFRARREMALAHLGLEQPQPARSLLLRSIEEARSLGARYECALSQKAWSEVGAFWGWEHTEEWGLKAQQTLRELGAWWELAPYSWTSGMPLEELGQAATAFLQQPGSDTRAPLQRWVSAQWVDRLQDTVHRSSALRNELQEAQRERERQNARWQAFVHRGPVEVSLAGESPSSGERFTLPVRHHQLEQCARLIETEMVDLRDQLHRSVQAAREVAPSETQRQLEAALLALENWHLGAHPPDFSLAGFAGDGELRLRGDLPWNRLFHPGRAALAGVLREALQNARKHRPGTPVEICFASGEAELRVTVTCLEKLPAGSIQNKTGFGLTSMQFRASLAGGQVQVDQNFTVTLLLPLSLEIDLSAPRLQSELALEDLQARL